MSNIYELLVSESLRRRPAMYIGRLSFMQFKSFIDGYYMALQLHNIEDTSNFSFYDFTEFVANKYQKPSPAGWVNIIYADNFCDEAQSFSVFFCLFDEFINKKKKDDFYLDLAKLYNRNLKQDDILFE